jgi:hypothetical protein
MSLVILTVIQLVTWTPRDERTSKKKKEEEEERSQIVWIHSVSTALGVNVTKIASRLGPWLIFKWWRIALGHIMNVKQVGKGP